MTVADRTTDLTKDVSGDLFGQTISGVVFFDEIVQITDVTTGVLHNQVQLGLRVDHLIQLDDIWVLLLREPRQQTDLLSELMKVFIVESQFVDYFDGDQFTAQAVSAELHHSKMA